MSRPTKYVKVGSAPKKAPCPCCGKKGARKEAFQREVQSLGYRVITILVVTYAEYRAKCDCCKTFRNTPSGVEPGCRYDNQVRQAVIERIIQDGLNVQRLQRALERDFYLKLSEGFIHDCIRREVARLDMQEYRQWALSQFSGILCVDEVHLGKKVLLLATDPVSDFPVAFALVSKNDSDHMKRFLQNLCTWGFQPEVVITDGSSLYPSVLAEVWPEARHQLCVFHVIQDINKHILDAVKRLRRAMAQKGKRGRRRGRGRPTSAQRRARKRAKKSLKDKAKFIFTHRYLIVKRRENLTAEDQEKLQKMFEYCPELRLLREFADRIYDLFEKEQSVHQAKCRRAALLRNASYQEFPELVKAMGMLSEEKFEKMIAFLHSPAHQQIRTNNHVERANRRLRYCEKVRYKWRRRRSIVRFVILAMVDWRASHASLSEQASEHLDDSHRKQPDKSERELKTAA